MSQEMITVRLMSGPQDGLGLEFPLSQAGGETVVTIGRSEDCDVSLPYDSQVSRVHARLICACDDETLNEGEVRRRTRLRLVDVGSRNGTYLGQQRLRDESAPLKPGDLFRVGRTWLRVDP